jgi:sigma-70-like protein
MKMRRLDTGSVLETAHDSWRTWLLTGIRRDPVDRRRIRGSHLGLKKMLLEGMTVRIDKPYTWKEFSDAMVRQSVGEAMHSMRREDSQLVKLAYFGGLSNAEIAGSMGMGEATVERRLRRALDVISHHIQRGRGMGQRVIAAIAVWLSGRWLVDAMHTVVPAGAVAAATVIMLADPAPAVNADRHTPVAVPGTTMTVVPPVPSPTTPVVQAPPATDPVPAVDPPTVPTPAAQVPVQVPQVPVPPLPQAPSPPPLPVKLKIS